SLISPAHQDAKLEDFKGLPGGRQGTARQFRRYPRELSGGSTVTTCSSRVQMQSRSAIDGFPAQSASN
ncbi:MAG TPA: hypothetical protein VKB62_03370, partial [Streptosporangiaceae bacterium]|nr:hypothetical protein [Streptosporangiaceae bacterium]